MHGPWKNQDTGIITVTKRNDRGGKIQRSMGLMKNKYVKGSLVNILQ